MTMKIFSPHDQNQVIEDRLESNSDRFDEVWEGVHVVSPLPNDEHQEIVANFIICFGIVIQYPKLGKVRPGVNISDRIENWEKNYRGPDVVVFRNDTQSENHKSFWLGGPDFAVEVVSQYDQSREKLDFYAKVGTRELLMVDRYPWALELYRLGDAGTLDLVGCSTLDQPDLLVSQVLPLSFKLHTDEQSERPRILVTHLEDARVWWV